MDDWTNRRRELKFSAADLKLWRRSQAEKIGHWDSGPSALPRTFMLWAARLGPKDSPEKMVRETSAIVATYLDGAGIFAYGPAPLADTNRSSSTSRPALRRSTSRSTASKARSIRPSRRAATRSTGPRRRRWTRTRCSTTTED